MHRELIDRLVQQFVARSRQQERFWRVALNGRFRSLFLLIEIERYSHCDCQALARGKERVAQDAIDPCPEISTQLKGRESSQRLNVGFLNQVFGFVAILREPMSEVVKLIEERCGQFFERVELEIRSGQVHMMRTSKCWIYSLQNNKSPGKLSGTLSDLHEKHCNHGSHF